MDEIPELACAKTTRNQHSHGSGEKEDEQQS
jgi:hypothetical protein